MPPRVEFERSRIGGAETRLQISGIPESDCNRAKCPFADGAPRKDLRGKCHHYRGLGNTGSATIVFERGAQVGSRTPYEVQNTVPCTNGKSK